MAADAKHQDPGVHIQRSYGLANLKRFAFAGPLGFDVGVAKDPTASEPDLTAGMNFTGLDWKLTRIVPRI